MEEELRKFQASYSEKKQLKISAERGTKVNLMAIDSIRYYESKVLVMMVHQLNH